MPISGYCLYVYNHNVIKYHPYFCFILNTSSLIFDIVMNSILLTGLFQRLLIALFALAAVWGVYFWAVA
ncbi:hypothetical protein NM96_06845 [Neisseria mucosa]|uniref:Uncharacterized protein n=1 Tax=Neisseria mucosa TaxID=488 RepID=A0ABN4Y898_NEIMU|nr:hypothetical protein A6J88_12485 [Neisseria mucosa]AVR80294.1 hypothetical protein NM96_06845 [Neisseria mucosa]